MISDNNLSDYRVPVPGKSYFEKLHTMVLVSIFPRSGSTLLGYLLTAHRNMVIANEPTNYREKLYSEVPPMALMNYILYTDKMRFEEARKVQSTEKPEKVSTLDNSVKRAYNKQDRYIFVPNQWQARCELLQVIGIKNSLPLAKRLSEEGIMKFKAQLRKVGIKSLKFISTVRNPYDMISTDVMYRARNPRTSSLTEEQKHNLITKKMKNRFANLCEITEKIIESSKAEDVFMHKHEDMVASPAKQLTKLCEFLKVPAFPDYLDDCASVVRKNANKSRHELDWSDQQKEEMAKLIDKYHFFSGYDWNT